MLTLEDRLPMHFLQLVYLVNLILCTDVHIGGLIKMGKLHSLILKSSQPVIYFKRKLVEIFLKYCMQNSLKKTEKPTI